MKPETARENREENSSASLMQMSGMSVSPHIPTPVTRILLHQCEQCIHTKQTVVMYAI